MSNQKKNIDLKSRIKRIFSSSKLVSDTEKTGGGSTESLSSTSDSDVVEVTMNPDAPQPVKPNRKAGRKKGSGGSLTNLHANVDNPAQVHGLASRTRKSVDFDVGASGQYQKTAAHLAEIAHLTIQNERLNKDNQKLRRHNHRVEESAGSPSMRFHQDNPGPSGRRVDTMESLLLDRELLENLVWRLSVEAGRYETRLQQLQMQISPDSVVEAEPQVSRGPAPAWCRADPATLEPLLHAYDEALLEKNQLLESYEQQLHKLGAECREIVSENDRLHEALDESLKKESEMQQEADMARRDVHNLHSENVILLEKLEHEKTSSEELAEEYTSKMSLIQELEMERINKQTEVKTLAREYSILEQKFVQAKVEMEKMVPAKHHENAIADLGELLEELKVKYNEDRGALEERNKTLLKEKVTTEALVRSLNSEAAQTEARLQALEKLLRKSETRCEQLQTRLVGAESCRDSSVRELRQLMMVAERLTSDQETLLQQLQLHQGTTRRLSVLRSSLKSVQKELPQIERQLRAQESGVERLKGDHQREMVRLHSMIRHKDKSIKQLQQERNLTCEQLEMMWKSVGFESLTVAEKDMSQPHSLPETHRSRISPKDS